MSDVSMNLDQFIDYLTEYQQKYGRGANIPVKTNCAGPWLDVTVVQDASENGQTFIALLCLEGPIGAD
jgi:hypothetical protein